MVFLAVDQDVIAEGLEPDRSLPHILRHLDAFSDLILTLVEQFLCGSPCPHLLSLQDSIDAIANPPNVASRFPLPQTPYCFPFSRHEYPLPNQNSKVSPEVAPALPDATRASLIERLLSL